MSAIKKPSGQEVRAYSDATGASRYEAKRHLEKRALIDAINQLPFASVELKEVLTELAKRTK